MVIRSIHWRISLRTTGNPPTSDFPSTTSSLAKTVPSCSHHQTGASLTKARRLESRNVRRLNSRFSSSVLSEIENGKRNPPGYSSVSIGSALFVFELNHEL